MFPSLTNLKTNQQPGLTSTGLGGDNRLQGSIATQDLGGNSLTQMMRSLQNYLSTQGQSTYQQGQDVTTTGLQGFGTAGNSAGTAMDTTGKALGTLDPAESYWSKLLSGDQKTMNQAIAPYATQAGTNYANASSNVAMNQPRGGYAGALAGELPFAQARDVNNQLFSLQPTAATNLNTIAQTKNSIAGTQGNIAGIQGQLATWLSSLGIDVSKLGAGLLSNADQSLLTGRGQDVGEHGQAMSLAGQTIGAATGLGSAALTGHLPAKPGCWIAEAIYGVDDPRTHLVRAWLNGPFRRTSTGRLVMWTYIKIGRGVAAMVRASGTLRYMFKPLFDLALTKALAEKGN